MDSDRVGAAERQGTEAAALHLRDPFVTPNMAFEWVALGHRNCKALHRPGYWFVNTTDSTPTLRLNWRSPS
jgi:hypothetical protein